MSALAVLLAAVLLAIAALHLAWAAGSTFPAASEGELARMVAGFADRDHMPPRPASALVAVALVVVAYVALALGSVCGWPFWAWSLPAAGMVVACVFFARGVAAFLPAWRALVPQNLSRALTGDILGRSASSWARASHFLQQDHQHEIGKRTLAGRHWRTGRLRQDGAHRKALQGDA